MLLGSAIWMLLFGWFAWRRWSSVRHALRVGQVRTGFSRGFGGTVYRSEPNEFRTLVRGRTASAVAYGALALLPLAAFMQLWLAGHHITL